MGAHVCLVYNNCVRQPKIHFYFRKNQLNYQNERKGQDRRKGQGEGKD